LYKAVHHVRQAFATVHPELPPEALLEIRDEVLSLKAPGGIHTDLEEFEVLAQAAIRDRDMNLLQKAVTAYRGDLLPMDLYEEWSAEYRDALRERFLELLVKLGEDYLAAGYPAEAGDVFRQVLSREPTREEAHRGLMRVYAARGSTARALHQHQLCKEVLVDELGGGSLYRDYSAVPGHPQRGSRTSPAATLSVEHEAHTPAAAGRSAVRIGENLRAAGASG
jgi:DNA-binding SARP family transcriptional activator